MPTRSQRIRQAVRGGPIDKLRAEVEDLKEQVKSVKPSHEIHADGTYSNHKTVTGTSVRPKVTLGQLVSFDGPYHGAGYVYEVREDGFWTRPRLDYAPDLSDCRFWSWEYVNRYMRGVV